MNPTNFVRVAALDANLCACQRLALRVLDDTAEPRLTRVSFQHQAKRNKSDRDQTNNCHGQRIRPRTGFVKSHPTRENLPAEGLEPTRSCDHWILSPALNTQPRTSGRFQLNK